MTKAKRIFGLILFTILSLSVPHTVLAQGGSTGRGMTSFSGGEDAVLFWGLLGLIIAAGIIGYILALNKTAKRERLSEIPWMLKFTFTFTDETYAEARDGANFKDIRQMPSGEVVRQPMHVMVDVGSGGNFRLPEHLMGLLTKKELD